MTLKQTTQYWNTLENKDDQSQAEVLHSLIEEAEAVVVGIGAGMSAAAGFTYIGKRFTDAFPDFIEKYNLLDLLQASLYKYEDELEYWAFQSRFLLMNYFDQPKGKVYTDFKNILADKKYHVITTNADNAFYASDYDMDKVFRIQGEYGLFQCKAHCHQQTYQNEELIRHMVREQENMKVPENLVPYCPECGEPLEVNKRTEEKGMVEDQHFHEQKDRYETFLKQVDGKKTLFLEIGVGHTTPQFIKHPFQEMTEENPKALFVIMNEREYFVPHAIRPRSIQLNEDIADVFEAIAQKI